ncbi:hypothetical protein [Streptosporangium sp. NPDC002721]|uniref:hypothetical protein n=1 Tax=Streptosporangium sp. NPDC002721 TaxID=3366188 RepID=UPI003675DFBF
MARVSPWKAVPGVVALGGVVFLLTGSAAHADPRPAHGAIELRLLADDCPAPTSATAP